MARYIYKYRTVGEVLRNAGENGLIQIEAEFVTNFKVVIMINTVTFGSNLTVVEVIFYYNPTYWLHHRRCLQLESIVANQVILGSNL